MYCKKCGKELKEGQKYCNQCGEPVDKLNVTGGNQFEKEAFSTQNYRGNPRSNQPTKALVVEGIGFLFFAYLLLVYLRNEYGSKQYLEEEGVGFFLIGIIIIVISYFMFRNYKKKHDLYGLGYAGYIISCIAVVIVFGILAMDLIILIFSIIAMVIEGFIH